VLRREGVGLSNGEIEQFLNPFIGLSNHHEIFFLWRPVLSDAKDELILELAVASGSRTII
jgi:hypothetical protein